MVRQVTKDEPTSFLSLPRELRQQIMALAFEDASNQDVHFNATVALLELDYIISNRGPYAAPHIFNLTAAFTSLHPIIKEDVPYV